MAHQVTDFEAEEISLEEVRRLRIAETLGSMPQRALSTLIGCGMTEEEIARYHGLPHDVVTALCDDLGIARE